uniref:Uncharacterized protein n=1 Tax=Oryza punctata TaxID=4537 RepID=A0A0E0KSE3_ORYPU
MHSPSLLLILCGAVASFLFLCGGAAATAGGRGVKMASSLYAPQLTRWRVTVGGVVRGVVEHEGKMLLVSRDEDRVAAAGEEEDEDEDPRELVEIGGRLFPVMDETEVALHGGKVARAVEYTERCSPARGVAPLALLLTVTEGKKKEVAEVVGAPPDGGVLRVVGCGCFADPVTGTVQHMVDVQGSEAFVLLVSVREELGRIVCIKRLN